MRKIYNYGVYTNGNIVDDNINEKYRATCKEWILLREEQLGRLLTPNEIEEIYEIIKKDFIKLEESE